MDFNDPTVQDYQAIQFAKAQLAKSGYDTKTSSQFGNGYILGFPYVEYFRVAAELPGGLNRTNLMLAVRSIEVRSPFMLPGIRLTMNGNNDAYMVEGSEIAKFSAANQSWETIADVIDLSGKSPNCAWNQNSAGCA